MSPEIQTIVTACEWGTSQFLILSSNVFAPLIYYSHLGAIIPTLGISLLIFFNGRRELPNILLLATATFFSLWVFCDLILWATEFPPYTMFFWSAEVILEPFVYFFALYFAYTYIYKKDLTTLQKACLTLPLLPILFFASSNFALLGYDISNCDRNAYEGIMTSYGYVLEIAYALLIVVAAIVALVNNKLAARKREIALLALGTSLFLLSFSLGNIVEVFTENWYIGQYGLFGAPIFTAFLAYLIVRYKAFNLKLIATQVLVTALWLLVMALLFVRTIENVRIVVAVTLIFVLILGVVLVRSVQREIKQREELAVANRGQENLIHVMNHQIKGYLGTARNIFAELSQSTTYGHMPEASIPLLNKGLEEMAAGVEYVQQILKGASAHSGTLPYNMRLVDLKPLVATLVSKQKEVAEKAGLTYESNISDGDYTITGDSSMLEEAFRNLITNAIKYNSPHGNIAVTLSRVNDRIMFVVKDTGIGISAEDAPKLFKPGGRGKDSIKFNVESSGFGLSFVRPVIEKHQGKVWYVSNSPEKGTTFFVELPIATTAAKAS